MLVPGQTRVPLDEHVMPKQGGEQESGRNRLAGAYAFIGTRQSEHHKALAGGLFENHIEQRQQAVMQPFGAQP